MVDIAYALSSEEHDARTLVATARRAEEAGFRSVWISDHYHPWMDRQGESPFVRLDMLAGAVEVMRALWSGDQVTHRGRHYTVENARLYTTPADHIPVIVSAFGPQAVDLAAAVGEGWITTGPDRDLLERYVAAVREYADAGFDEVALTQIGPDQDGFFRFYERELRTRVGA